jgi:hypothetical protein
MPAVSERCPGASQLCSDGVASRDGEAVAQDEAVGPLDVVLVELDGFAVLLLRVGEEGAGHLLPGRHAKDCMGRDTLVDVQGDRVDLAGLCFALAGPLEPGLMPAGSRSCA